MDLFLYNTLARKKERFVPLSKKEVGMYSCGPTVYGEATIGNMRTYIFSDILKRVLLYNGYAVTHIMNVTDVGHLVGDGDVGRDKIEEAALKEHKKAKDIAKHYFSLFESDMKKLNILKPSKFVWATAHIKEQIALIQRLEKKGYIYKTTDGVYFDSSRFKQYGDFAHLTIRGLQAGKRVLQGEKKHATDFALWKFSERPGERQQEWNSPWGIGYPGWHIECSAMAMKYLGERFDIHTGGEDHIPVHHTNEIAQSECASGKKFVNYWLHGAFLTFKGEKVSKSKGGLYTIQELEELGYRPEHYRYLCLQAHYRTQLDFSLEALDAARTAYERIYRAFHSIGSAKGSDQTARYERKFHETINDDLMTPRALTVFLEALHDATFDSRLKKTLLVRFDTVLGLGFAKKRRADVIPQKIQALVGERERARTARDWQKADEIRMQLHSEGYLVEDTPTGPYARKV